MIGPPDFRPYLWCVGILATGVALITFRFFGYPYAAEFSLVTGVVSALFTWALIAIGR